MSATIETRSLDVLAGILTAQISAKLPLDVAKYELTCAARKLSETCLLTVDLVLETQKNCQDYYFDNLLPDQHQAIGFEAIKYCGQCLTPIDKCDPCPRGYELLSPTGFALHPCPTSDGQPIEVCVSLEPQGDVCELPAIFIDRYDKTLIEMAKGELLLYPNSDWTRPNIAQVHLRRGQAACINEAVSQSRGHDRNVRVNCGSPVV
jgi:hypothetical protein